MKSMRGEPRGCKRGAALRWLPAGMLALAGCGMFDSTPAVPPPGQPILPSASAPVPGDATAACLRQADNDPTVQSWRMRQLAGGVGPNSYQKQIDQATKEVVDRCLMAMGLGRPGGVRPIGP